MTATGEPETPDESTGEDDHRYFLQLEDLFIGLRGAPFLLSPSDWQTAKAWRRQGIPLELVRRVLREVFERREERGADDIVSLRYFKRPVENAWKKARELAAGGERAEPEPFDLEGRLQRLAAALPADLAERERWANEIGGLAGGSNEGAEQDVDMELDMETVEERLGAMESEVLAAVSTALDEAVVRELEQKVEEALSRLARRLPEEEKARSRRHLHRRLLRQHAGLPVLSLFSPEAEGS